MMKEQASTKEQVLKILRIVGNVLAWLFLIFALFTTVLSFTATRNTRNNVRIPKLGKTVFLSVQTTSMEPTIMAGDMIIGKEAATDDIKVGDVITFLADVDLDGRKQELNTHRVVEIEKHDVTGEIISFTTRGDAAADEAITERVYPEDVVARWNDKKPMKGVGKAIDFLQSRTGFLVCIVLPMAVFFLYEIIHFVVVLMTVRRPAGGQSATTLSVADEEEIRRRAVEEYLRQQEEAKKADEPAPVSKKEDPDSGSDDRTPPTDNP